MLALDKINGSGVWCGQVLG